MRGGGLDLFGHVIEVGFVPYQLCFQHEMQIFSGLPGSGGGATLPTTRVALLPRGPRTPHATYRASGEGGAVALRWAGGVPSDLQLLP